MSKRASSHVGRQAPIPPLLVESILSRSCVIFVGAGLSKPAGLPSWVELSRAMAKSASCPPDMDPLLVAQAFEVSQGRAALNRFLKDRLAPEKDGDIRCYDLIAKLPVRVFVTTNYDNFLEDALKRAGRSCLRAVIDQGLSQWVPNQDTLLLKLHGSLDAGQYVITENDYQSFEREYPGAVSVLLHLLTTNTFLFVGCSLTDPGFRRVYDLSRWLLRKNYRQHFVLKIGKADAISETWKHLGITAVDLSGKGISPTDKVVQYLEELVRMTLQSSSALSERQAIFVRDEACYLGDEHRVRSLHIRKESGLGFLGIPDDTASNPFSSFDQPVLRHRTALERKRTYRKFIEGGARLSWMVSVDPDSMTRKGYNVSQTISRLQAVAEFVKKYLHKENFRVAVKTYFEGDIQLASYNEDVLVQSARHLGPRSGHGDDRSLAIRDIDAIRGINAMFDERFAKIQEANLAEAHRERIGLDDTPDVRVKQLLISKLDQVQKALASQGGS